MQNKLKELFYKGLAVTAGLIFLITLVLIFIFSNISNSKKIEDNSDIILSELSELFKEEEISIKTENIQYTSKPDTIYSNNIDSVIPIKIVKNIQIKEIDIEEVSTEEISTEEILCVDEYEDSLYLTD